MPTSAYNKYMRDFPRSAKIDLAAAMEALNTEKRIKVKAGLPDAVEGVLNVAAAVALGPLLLVGLEFSLLRKLWHEDQEKARSQTYFAVVKLIEITDRDMQRYSNVSMSDPRWTKVRDNLVAIEALIKILQAAAK
jgi:hypothetical protein